MRVVLCMSGFGKYCGRANWEETRRIGNIITMLAPVIMEKEWFKGETLWHWPSTDLAMLAQGARGVTLDIRQENIRRPFDERQLEAELRAETKKLLPEEVSVAVLV